MKGKIEVLCTTTAFGLGIDKPNIRYVIHHTMPTSLESYYQQTGRAGRDGKPSTCIMFYVQKDLYKIRTVTINSYSSDILVDMKEKQMTDINDYANSGISCRRVKLLAHFRERYIRNDSITCCDNCTKRLTLLKGNTKITAKVVPTNYHQHKMRTKF